MQCPVCQMDQIIVEYDGVELDLCLDGHGIWFDADELRQLFESAGAPAMLQDLERRLVVLPRGEHGPKRRCPRCRGKMRHVAAPGRPADVILDRCRRGHGIWFDKGELEEILALELGEEDAALARVRAFLGSFVTSGPTPSTHEGQDG
ncbi:MAG: zf-TFIIB domain-containing protein [Myxococcales bacterium]|nr:zf-TFIIB domain-containing protein [Myxococcales bacterium]